MESVTPRLPGEQLLAPGCHHPEPSALTDEPSDVQRCSQQRRVVDLKGQAAWGGEIAGQQPGLVQTDTVVDDSPEVAGQRVDVNQTSEMDG